MLFCSISQHLYTSWHISVHTKYEKHMIDTSSGTSWEFHRTAAMMQVCHSVLVPVSLTYCQIRRQRSFCVCPVSTPLATSGCEFSWNARLGRDWHETYFKDFSISYPYSHPMRQERFAGSGNRFPVCCLRSDP